jgi:TonB family protein
MQPPSGSPRKYAADSDLDARREPLSVHAALHPVRQTVSQGQPGLSLVPRSQSGAGLGDVDLWHDVFVHQPLPWWRFLESAVLHAGAAALIWLVSIAWLRQQPVTHPVFDRSSVITYSPQEYLPPLDTGAPRYIPPQLGDPAYAPQAILSVPPEADNRRQTIVAPPNVHLNRDVPLPNIVATGTVTPEVPLEATRSSAKRFEVPDTAVVAPAPELNATHNRAAPDPLHPQVVAPPPELALQHTRGVSGPDASVVAPPPELAATRGRASDLNIGPSQVVAPAPQLAMSEQHTRAARGGGLVGGDAQPIAPPPTIGSSGGTSSRGNLIALGVSPVAPTGPVAVPGGNRRGTFAATPQGRPGAAGTPDSGGTVPGTNGVGAAGNGQGGFHGRDANSVPSGLHVGAPPAGAVGAVQNPDGTGSSGGAGAGKDPQLMASVSAPRVSANSKPAALVPEDKVTAADREVFHSKRFYAMTLNLPNFNSATGSWVVRFAELKAGQPAGELYAPVPTEKSDPGYPPELAHDNVQGTVTLYAVIHSDGSVGDIRVLSSPDERLDAYARAALSRWKFIPAEKNGKPVALEAVVMIPFRTRRSF